MSVFAPGIINLWKTIETYGIDPEPLFAAEGIRIQYPVDPYKRVDYEKVDRIRAAAVKLSGDEAFGLRTARVYAPSQLGALGYAWQASLTLRGACMRLERFMHLVSDKAGATVEDRDGFMVVTLEHQEESRSQRARDDCELAMMEKGDIVFRVKAVIQDQLPMGNLSDETVADALHVSVRSMHRRLTDAGSNFRSLLVNIRRELAESYILDNSLTLTEISLLLGFSEPSSFSRAFKNWTGNAPSTARQAASCPVFQG